MKRCLTSLTIRGMQTETTVRYITSHLLEWLAKECGEMGNVYCWSESKQLLWKTVWRFLKKLKTELSYNSAVRFWMCIHRKHSYYLEEVSDLRVCCSVALNSQVRATALWPQATVITPQTQWQMSGWKKCEGYYYIFHNCLCYIIIGISFSCKNGNPALCDNMDGP